MRPHELDPCLIVDGQVAFAVRQEVAVLVFAVERWDMETADTLFRESTALCRPAPHSLITHLAAEPGAHVRKRLSELQRELEATQFFDQRRVAVITDSVATRGAITAWRWLTGSQMQGFPARDLSRASEWVCGERSEPGVVAAAFRQCSGLLEDVS